MAKKPKKIIATDSENNQNTTDKNEKVALIIENQLETTTEQLENSENQSETNNNADKNTKIDKNTTKIKFGNSEEEEKPRRTPSIPVRYTSVANATNTVLRQWGANYPQFTCVFVDYNTLQTESDKLNQMLSVSATYKSSKTENTTGLGEINKEIDKKLTIIKNHIKSEYAIEPNIEIIYYTYGMVKNAGGVYGLPRDNHERGAAINILVAKMQERNNPIAHKQFGLATWQTLQQQHSSAWQLSETLRSNRSFGGTTLKEQYDIVRDLLNVLHKYIAIAFRKQDYKRIIRSFGFLKESF